MNPNHRPDHDRRPGGPQRRVLLPALLVLAGLAAAILLAFAWS